MSSPSDSPRRRWNWLFALAVLLVLPGLAVARLGGQFDVRWILIAWVAISGFSLMVQMADKSRAEAGEWRISEAVLHLLELLGGWPGSFAAQRWFRHKTAKAGYQIIFWLIVALHQFLALDYLLGWQMSRALALALRSS